MRVLVSGGARFVGGDSCRLLRERGHEVAALDDLSHGKRENVPEGVRLVVRDIRAADVLQGEKPDAVLHLAAQMDVRKSVADPLFDASVNVLGTLNVLEGARRAGVKRFVFAWSGGAIYGEQETFPASESHPRRPASPYGVSKLCAEEYVTHYALAHGLSTLSLRYANVYGPGQDPLGEAGVVAIFLHRMLGGQDPMINGNGEQTRDYVHVEDVARVNCDALESRIGGALNVGTRREPSVNGLARLLAGAGRVSGPIRPGPGTAGRPRRSPLDASAARAQLGWEPRIALEPGLIQTAQWFKRER